MEPTNAPDQKAEPAAIGGGARGDPALLVAVAANLVFALILYAVIRLNSRYLQFPATIRSLRPLSPNLQPSDKLR